MLQFMLGISLDWLDYFMHCQTRSDSILSKILSQNDILFSVRTTCCHTHIYTHIHTCGFNLNILSMYVSKHMVTEQWPTTVWKYHVYKTVPMHQLEISYKRILTSHLHVQGLHTHKTDNVLCLWLHSLISRVQLTDTKQKHFRIYENQPSRTLTHCTLLSQVEPTQIISLIYRGISTPESYINSLILINPGISKRWILTPWWPYSFIFSLVCPHYTVDFIFRI